MATNTVSMREVKNILNYMIDNNLKRQEDGKMPIAMSLEASAGIGKTSIVQQVAEERGMKVTKLNMSQLQFQQD